MRKLSLLLLILITLPSFGQKMNISGTVHDTVAKSPLQFAVATAVRIKDSVLIAYARTDANGRFELKNLPIDTVSVTISNPKFGDQSFYVFGSPSNHEFDFGKIILPPKSLQLNEVVIYAFKDPVYYKGDTLVYTADSFKVKPNATVEDLLRKLPGIKVDAQGKITSQGKEVSQVLVDGDEFFGADPTVATKNLSASGVESVQVYEKKNESTAEGAAETIQVMDLKMKDEAKKGYFGKISGAGGTDGTQPFYEGEFLANKFKNKQKISVFALGSNTPRSNFGWGDIYKYGLNDDMNYSEGEDGTTYWFTNGDQPQGIPQTLKSGFYYADKLGKKTKINVNYSYSNNLMKAKSTTHSQYFLADTTYNTDNASESRQLTEGHSINFGIFQTIDSLTDLEISPKIRFNTNKTSSKTLDEYLTSTDTLTRTTEVENSNKANGYDINTTARLNRRFKKKDRFLMIYYNNVMKKDDATNILKSNNLYFSGFSLPNDTIDQQKLSSSDVMNHSAKLTFTEPLTKKIKLEFEYNFAYNTGKQSKKAQNKLNGEYSVADSAYSNDFETFQMINKAGLKFIYETKKTRVAFGSRVQQRDVMNNNLILDQKFRQTGQSVLPYATFMYRFSDNSRMNLNYYTGASQPTMNQLQPVPDNTNPNLIRLGNTELKQSYSHKFELQYNTYKPLTGRYIWANLNYSITNNAFSNSTSYDTIGRAISQTVNVDGNYNASAYAGGGLPVFDKALTFSPSINYNMSQNTNFVNDKRNVSLQNNMGVSMDIDIDIDTLMFQIGASYNYNTNSSSLNSASSKPYTSQTYTAELTLKLPWKFSLETDAEYNINSQRTAGYNINYILWNATINKAFLKNENLILSVIGTDLLNQNINTNRNIQDNVITDTKTNIISRYFLLKLVYKFNSTKTKEEENDWF